MTAAGDKDRGQLHINDCPMDSQASCSPHQVSLLPSGHRGLAILMAPKSKNETQASEKNNSNGTQKHPCPVTSQWKESKCIRGKHGCF